MHVIKTFIIAIITLFPAICTAQTANVSIEFMSRNELVWSQYKSNKYQIDNLYSLISNYAESIKQGKFKVNIQTNATSFDDEAANKQLAAKRAQQLISLLTTKLKITAEDCKVTTITTPLQGKPDVAIVSLIATATQPKPQSPQQTITTPKPIQTPSAATKTNDSSSKNKSTTKKSTPKAKPETEQTKEETIPVSPILTNVKPESKPKNFLKPPQPPQAPAK